jgi:propanol-preferring alcohol dehydrogenase
MMNDLGFAPMSSYGVRSPGHEGTGVVVKVGSNVKNWNIGDRGGVKPCWDVCMSCHLCWGLHETYCEEGIQTGLEVTGTYQQYIVSPAKYTTRIPDKVDDFCAGPIMCSGSTIYRSVGLIKVKSLMDANGLLSYSFANLSSNVAIGRFSLVPEAV